jgi:hypothetical protein
VSAKTKLWVLQWQRVGRLLERIRHDELRAMTDEQAAQAFEAVSELATEMHNPICRTTSGFVDQQRLFKQLVTNGPAD